MSDYKNDILNAKDYLVTAAHSLKKFSKLVNKIDENGSWVDEADDDLRSLYFLFNQLDYNYVGNLTNAVEGLNRPVVREGIMVLQDNDRYSIDGFELSSGSPVEIYDDEDEEEHYHHWYQTRLEFSHEHDGYYAVGRPKMKLPGKRARIRY